MKVIRKGRDPNMRVRAGECSNCDAYVECCEYEIVHLIEDVGIAHVEKLARHPCPECSSDSKVIIFYPTDRFNHAP